MDREKLRREAVRQLRRLATGSPVEKLLTGVKLGKNGVELSFYNRLEAIDRLLELAGPGGDDLMEQLGLSDWNGTGDE